jgi:rhodanese-related sulfurtransferase
MPGPNSITTAQLARLIGTPDCPLILDVRLPEDAALDPRLIPTAQAVPHLLVTAPKGARVIVTCQRGRKLSEGSAALLRSRGVQAETLEGGHVAWAEAGLPLVPAALMAQTALWVTRHRPKIDRIACPWLIRRFVNPAAQFLFVAPAEVPAVAQYFTATPFDIEGVTFTHRGEGCSFDALLDDFNLHSPALDRLALVIRGADTDRHELAPQSAGLLALSVGLSRQYRDDLQQLDAAMPLYDALYRWARDGHDEGHDWPAGRAQ